jgi:phenylalanyl-tRNA synthetase alpha chain
MDIHEILAQIDAQIQGIGSREGLEEFRVKYLGRKGVVAQLTGSIPTLPVEERGRFGQQVNALKNKIKELEEKSEEKE